MAFLEVFLKQQNIVLSVTNRDRLTWYTFCSHSQCAGTGIRQRECVKARMLEGIEEFLNSCHLVMNYEVAGCNEAFCNQCVWISGNMQLLEKGKPSERVGRKAAGLSSA
jgi:hypothetical protein